jgi:hypothetical protein
MLETEILERARQYTSPMEFVKNERRAYEHARKKQIVQECYAHMPVKRQSWNFEKIKVLAAKYTRRVDFKSEDNAAYIQARRTGVLDDVCSHMDKTFEKWDKDLCSKEAAKYATRTDFAKGNPGAYQHALKEKLLDEICQHMGCGLKRNGEAKKIWTVKEILRVAATCETRTEFKRKHPGAYRAALRLGVLGIAQKSKKLASSAGANDIVYIWKAVGFVFNGEQVYKIGHTSSHLAEERVMEVARKAKIKPEIVLFQKVADARVLEKEMLKYGQNPGYSKFDGSTEFRALTCFQLQQLKLLAVMQSSATELCE